MTTDSVARKIEATLVLTEAERALVRDLVSKVVAVGPGEDIVGQGRTAAACCVLLDGTACRYLSLPTGQRQITAFNIAGDWIDLNSFFFDRMDHSIGAITHCRVAHVPHSRLLNVIETQSRLARALWRESMIDASISREWVVNVGARQARQRMAHLFCEQHARLQAIGLADGPTFELPLTQADLGEALGISTVHANRTLQELRAEKLIVFHRKVLTIVDVPRLTELGQFDPTYLHLGDRHAEGQRRAEATIGQLATAEAARVRPGSIVRLGRMGEVGCERVPD